MVTSSLAFLTMLLLMPMRSKGAKWEDVKQYVLNNQVDEIYCTMTDMDSKRVNELIDFAEANKVPVKVVPDFRDINYRKINLDFYDEFPVLTFREIPLDDALTGLLNVVLILPFHCWLSFSCFPGFSQL